MNFARQELEVPTCRMGPVDSKEGGRAKGRERQDASRLSAFYVYVEGASNRPENPVFPGIKPVRAGKKEERTKRKLGGRVTSGNLNRAICTGI